MFIPFIKNKLHFIHIPIQELGFDGVGDLSIFPFAPRSVFTNTAARCIQKTWETSLTKLQFLNRNVYSSDLFVQNFMLDLANFI